MFPSYIISLTRHKLLNLKINTITTINAIMLHNITLNDIYIYNKGYWSLTLLISLIVPNTSIRRYYAYILEPTDPFQYAWKKGLYIPYYIYILSCVYVPFDHYYQFYFRGTLSLLFINSVFLKSLYNNPNRGNQYWRIVN